MPKDLCWEVWRVVLAKIATLHEVETKWNLCDLMDANEALDVMAEMEQEAQERNQRNGNR